METTKPEAITFPSNNSFKHLLMTLSVETCCDLMQSGETFQVNNFHKVIWEDLLQVKWQNQ
jgi:hypothetical protein